MKDYKKVSMSIYLFSDKYFFTDYIVSIQRKAFTVHLPEQYSSYILSKLTLRLIRLLKNSCGYCYRLFLVRHLYLSFIEIYVIRCTRNNGSSVEAREKTDNDVTKILISTCMKNT